MNLTIVTPEREILKSTEVKEIIIPGIRGELGILKGHVPLVTTLGAGLLRYKLVNEDSFHEIAISWGYCEVRADQQIVILAENAETKKQMDKEKIQKALANILEKLKDVSLSPSEIRKLRKEEREMNSRLQLFK